MKVLTTAGLIKLIELIQNALNSKYDTSNPSGFITGINSSDVTTALGYTPYNVSNPNGYTSNVGTVTSVNNIAPDANGNVTISTGGGAVDSVNGQTGDIVLTASDVGALPDTTIIPTNANYVDLTTSQTIAGYKTFTRSVYSPTGFIAGDNNDGYNFYIATNPDTPNNRTNISALRKTSNAIEVGTEYTTTNILGTGARPTYNNQDIALYSDISGGGSAEITNPLTFSKEDNGTTYTYTAGFDANNRYYETITTDNGSGGSTIRVPKTYQAGNGISIARYQDNNATFGDYGLVSARVDGNYIKLVNGNISLDTSSLASVATSGSYNDLSDKPTIPDTSNLVTTNTTQTISGDKTFTSAITSYYGITIDGTLLYNASLTAKISSTRTDNLINSSLRAGITVGDSNQPLTIRSSNTRPRYFDGTISSEIALLSDIPTVPTTDQTYNDSSTNPQSGIAVSEALQSVEGEIASITGNLTEKADVDLSNVDSIGTTLGASWAMPSNRYTDLSLGASGTTYTAPANGYFYIAKYANTSDVQDFRFVALYNNNTRIESQVNGAYRFNLPCCVAAKKGDVVSCNYNARGSTGAFKFIYAQGSES